MKQKQIYELQSWDTLPVLLANFYLRRHACCFLRLAHSGSPFQLLQRLSGPTPVDTKKVIYNDTLVKHECIWDLQVAHLYSILTSLPEQCKFTRS